MYWKKGAADTLSTLDPSMSLRDALQNAFAIQESPIWMDSSTASQVQTLEKCVGGAQELANLTGSAGIERFTGAQILKMAQNRSEEFTLTERISLVSSFVPSILIQKYAPIDSSDGSGMNLLDIKTKEWDSRLLHRVGVGERLGHRVVNGHDVLGQIGPYFTQKYGISKGMYFDGKGLFNLIKRMQTALLLRSRVTIPRHFHQSISSQDKSCSLLEQATLSSFPC